MFKILDEIFGSKSSDNLAGDSELADPVPAESEVEREADKADKAKGVETLESRQAVKPPRKSATC